VEEASIELTWHQQRSTWIGGTVTTWNTSKCL